jgi:uncharacterized protein YecE (DUF72 family)
MQILENCTYIAGGKISYVYDHSHPRIKEAEIGEQMVRIYFNNHARSKAAANAFQLMDHLEIPHEPKKIRLQDQFTLGCF